MSEVHHAQALHHHHRHRPDVGRTKGRRLWDRAKALVIAAASNAPRRHKRSETYLPQASKRNGPQEKDAAQGDLGKGPAVESEASSEGKRRAVVEDLRPCIKVRIVTWNMHDSVPFGDLTELLGSIPDECYASEAWTRITHEDVSIPIDELGRTEDDRAQTPPPLPLDDSHPYHLIAIGGQECPIGGLGDVRGWAAGAPGWTDVLVHWLCRGGGRASRNRSRVQPEGEEGEKSEGVESEGVKEEPVPAKNLPSDADPSSVLEEVSSQRLQRTNSATSSVSSTSAGEDVGPYVLVAKERMMGIYLAIFAWKGCEFLLRRTSRGKVTSGLIGGRVGNKGAVGISLLFGSARLLFVSAHLAAHQSHVSVRKANVEKIFSELDVDDFSKPTSWKLGKESREKRGKDCKEGRDVTESFDQTFLFGDLNFRLEISRLHADWLLQAKDYKTALEFDQLKAVLRETSDRFGKFQEAPINFPPTYKYDVLRLKRPMSSRRVLDRNARKAHETSKPPRSPTLSVHPGRHHALSDPIPPSAIAQAAIPASINETPPLVSSRASTSSIGTSLNKGDLEPLKAGSAAVMEGKEDISPELTDPELLPAVQKAKVKFLTLVRSKSTGYFGGPATLEPKPTDLSERATSLEFPRNQLSASASMAKSFSTDGTGHSKSEIVEEYVDAVFDSSSKQRVQSWTDRILFKSTVKPPTTSETLASLSTSRQFGAAFFSGLRSARKSLTGSKIGPIREDLSDHPSTLAKVRSTSQLKDSTGAGQAGPEKSSDRVKRVFHRQLSRHHTEDLAVPDHSVRGRSQEERRSLQLARSSTAPENTLPEVVDSPGVSPSSPEPAGHVRLFRPRRPSARASSVDPLLTITPPSPLPEAPPDVSKGADVPAADPLSQGLPRSRSFSEALAPLDPLHPQSHEGPDSLLKPSVPVQSSSSFPSTSVSHHPNPPASRRKSLLHSVTMPAASEHDEMRESAPHFSLRWWQMHLSSLFSTSSAHEAPPPPEPAVKEQPKIGPLRGEIQCISYTSVNDLRSLGAFSDHRPVVGTFAVGV